MAEAYAADQQGKPPDLATKKKIFDEARTLTQDARTASEIDRDYYDNAFPDTSQLTTTQRAILQDRRQPEIVANRIKPAINGILGVVVQGKTDPRAYMRNPPKDQPPGPPAPAGTQGGLMGGAAPQPMAMAQPPLDAGDVATMTLRFIADANRFASVKLDVLENGGVEGCGAAIIEVDADREVTVSQIRWEEFFYDPRSRKHDFSDARYMGVAKWMYGDDVAAIYPEKKVELETTVGSGDASSDGSSDQSWSDRPQDNSAQPWVDRRQGRLMVVEMYYREAGVWHKCVFHSGGLLESIPSPYVDDRNRTLNPIEAWSCFVDRRNRRYGWVRDMRGPQDEINLKRIKAAHELACRQLQQVDPNSPPIDADTARKEAARPDGIIPTGWQVVPRTDVFANSMEMLQEAKSEIERLGPTPAILGRQNASASGRADQVKQQAGMTELARSLGRYQDWELRCYRGMWARARQFWDEPKWIRVADDDGAPKYVMVNEPAPVDPYTQQPVGPPKNHIAKMDVDIIVDSVPDTATLQQEVFAELMQLAQAYAGTPQAVPFKMAIELSTIPKKRELIQKYEQFQAEQAAAMQQQTQLQVADAASKIDKTVAETKKIEVETTTEALHGAMEASAAHRMPPGVSEIANLPQNKPQPNGAGQNA